jgi:WD40 repeat protein
MTLVRGTRFSVRAGAGGETLVSTREGTVTVWAAGSAVTVTTGLQTTVTPGDAPAPPEEMPVDEQIRWGMAVGPDLSVVLPIVHQAYYFEYVDGYAIRPQCSYDGQYITLTGVDPTVEPYRKEFYVYDLDASSTFTLTMPPYGYQYVLNPAGDGMAYSTETEVCTTDITGSSENCLGEWNPLGEPAWSPDGEWLLFHSNMDGTTVNLFKVRPDGSELTQLTFDEEGDNRSGYWSPDGSQIAYLHAPDGYENPSDLRIVDADGSGIQTVMSGTVRSYAAIAWNPSGSLLAVRRQGEGEYGAEGGLWMVPTDGSDPWQLAGSEGLNCYDISWSASPDGWPFFFRARDPELDEYLIRYATGPDSTAVPLVAASWGPAWCAGDVPRALFGYEAGTEDVRRTGIYVFDLEPDFYVP